MIEKVRELSVADVWRLIEQGVRPKFIEVRDDGGQPAVARIPGAIHVPVEAAGTHVARLPRERQLIAYGAGDDHSQAAELALILSDYGFATAYLRGGIDAWLGAGLPVCAR